jgi:hypothetical protein
MQTLGLTSTRKGLECNVCGCQNVILRYGQQQRGWRDVVNVRGGIVFPQGLDPALVVLDWKQCACGEEGRPNLRLHRNLVLPIALLTPGSEEFVAVGCGYGRWFMDISIYNRNESGRLSFCTRMTIYPIMLAGAVLRTRDQNVPSSKSWFMLAMKSGRMSRWKFVQPSTHGT